MKGSGGNGEGRPSARISGSWPFLTTRRGSSDIFEDDPETNKSRPLARYVNDVLLTHYILSIGCTAILTLCVLIHTSIPSSASHAVSVFWVFFFAQIAGFLLEHSWSGESLKWYLPWSSLLLFSELIILCTVPIHINLHFLIAAFLLSLQNLLFLLFSNGKWTKLAIFNGSCVLFVLLLLSALLLRVQFQATVHEKLDGSVFIAIGVRLIVRLVFTIFLTLLVSGKYKQGGFDFLILYGDFLYLIFILQDVPILSAILTPKPPESLLYIVTFLISDILYIWVESRVSLFTSLNEQPGVMNLPRPWSPIHCFIDRLFGDGCCEEKEPLLNQFKPSVKRSVDRTLKHRFIHALVGDRQSVKVCPRIPRLIDEFDDFFFNGQEAHTAFQFQRRRITFQQHLFATLLCSCVAPLVVVRHWIQLISVASLLLLKLFSDLVTWKALYVPEKLECILDSAWTGNASAWGFRFCSVAVVTFCIITPERTFLSL